MLDSGALNSVEKGLSWFTSGCEESQFGPIQTGDFILIVPLTREVLFLWTLRVVVSHWHQNWAKCHPAAGWRCKRPCLVSQQQPIRKEFVRQAGPNPHTHFHAYSPEPAQNRTNWSEKAHGLRWRQFNLRPVTRHCPGQNRFTWGI